MGNTTDYRYNSLGQMVAMGDARSTTPSLRTFYRRGDTAGTAVAGTNFGNLTFSYYNAAGQKVKEEALMTASGHGDGLHIGRTIHGAADVLPMVDAAQGANAGQAGGDGIITTKYEFSPDGQMTALVDDNGNRTEWSYDSARRKVVETKGLNQAPALADRADSPTSINWTYNSDGTVQTQTKEDGTVLHYDYDTARRLTHIYATSVPAAVGSTEQTFEYNGLGARMKSTDNNYSGTADDVTATWYYDSLGRVVEEGQKIGASGTARFFSTDYSGNDRASLVYPNGRRIRYSVHAGGALKSIYDDGLSANPIARYDYFGERTLRRAMQNGIDLDLRNGASAYYDALGRPTRWAHVNSRAGNALVVGWERSYDVAGNVIAQRSLHDPKDSQRYAYDLVNRLTAFSRGDFAAVAGGAQVKPDSPAYCDVPTAAAWSGMAQAQEWHLDGVGNWDKFTAKIDGTTTNEDRLNTSFNEYYQIGLKTVLHDDNGNMTSGTLGADISSTGGLARQLKWDVFNRLREVRTTTDSLVATYLYDAGNRRMRKDFANANDIDFNYTNWQIGETRDPAAPTVPKRQFVYGNYIDEPLSMDVNGNGDSTCVGTGDARHFYHANPIYSVGALSNATAGVVEAYEYDPYGQHVLIQDGNDGDSVVNFGTNDVRMAMGLSASALANPYCFTGREYDPESQMHCFRNRPDDTGMGRFTRKDPIGYSEGTNLFAYLDNNPIKGSDPSGLWNPDIHNEATARWAREDAKYPDGAASAIGAADAAVDGNAIGFGSRSPMPWGDQSYHFNRNLNGGGDSRLQHYQAHLARAKVFCTPRFDSPSEAVQELGLALHPYQDWVAHGDHTISDEGGVYYLHNESSPKWEWPLPYTFPDNPDLDAVGGPDGRPAGAAMHFTMVNGGTAVRDYAIYTGGHKRLNKTHEITTKELNDYLSFVKASGGCNCKEYFGLLKPKK